ncbi:uncharacterized protein MKK02DRAFT_38465 [Dioszegia hungarica]|uniref:Uncharacterized protein n=1 Tax=Dioszegia hungarica TaxID=4972 RepID=A0AA38LR20_9TREE|nr:uncharacterized protein MKK02DRAFT_38465 [Dioszegia hungarica]KAI9633807.1 hypothetical protein MKK02DRAFT_38465 [Dioszegia hungarica]
MSTSSYILTLPPISINLRPPLQALCPLPAGEEVWKEYPELRQLILGFVPLRRLPRFMLLGKEYMADVAAVMYHTVGWKQVRNNMTVATARQRLYCAAVHTIDARKLEPTPAMLHLHDLIVTQLRRKFTRLRCTLFGTTHHTFGGDEWTVHFDEPADGDQGDEGVFTVYHTLAYNVSAPPPSAGPDDAGSQDDAGQWLHALRGPRFAGLCAGIDLANLPVSLKDLVKLYQNQTAAGLDGRLSQIVAKSLIGFTVPLFRSFAAEAGSALTCLRLSSERTGAASGVAFQDLPQFVGIVREHLPSLVQLSFHLQIQEEEEANCVLPYDTLRSGGKVRILRITTDNYKGSMFNLLRLLVPMCTENLSRFAVDVQTEYDNRDWRSYQQSEYIKELRRQPAIRRTHLATIDWATLGVTKPLEVAHIEYSADGRPQHLQEGAAVLRFSAANDLRDKLARDIVPGLRRAAMRQTETAQAFRTAASSAVEPIGTVKELEKLVVSIKDFQNVVGQARERFETIDRVRTALRRDRWKLEYELGRGMTEEE